ncbi:MAG TPA: chemotaxis protein CheB [Steroidobacteraceae bacterium]|jgi:two-component system chemotaxis response regulator CheB|nr:chemotaxis protein CheB [Steroidobacteraceae bacterium]
MNPIHQEAGRDDEQLGFQAARGILVIGASRGGLEAISTIARSLSPDLPVAVAAVLHSAPDGPRILAEIIGARAALPVSYATQGAALLPGHLYIAPPDAQLIVAAPGMLGLEATLTVRNSRPAADPLFESAAKVYKDRVIGVVLTGDDGDGTAGLRAIHAAGGIAVIQEPSDAFDPSMPESALYGDDPDYRVQIEDMGALLTTLTHLLGTTPHSTVKDQVGHG